MLVVNGKEYKTAIVHDWFCNMGGGDKVAEAFLDILPESPIYTLCYLENSLTDKLRTTEIVPSFLQKRINQKNDNHQKFLPFMPSAIESFDMNDYDIVISSSSCCAKGVITNPNSIHICYCHTPMRYAWEYFGEYTEGMSVIKKRFVNYLMNYMRLWDFASAQRVDCFIANSRNVANRIRKHYGRESIVVNPPIDVEFFVPGNEEGDFYLVVSRLVKYKRIDLAVEACNKLGRKLVVIGGGAELDHLKKIAGPTVKIMGRQSDDVIKDYYQKCKAFLFPGEEDFGMTPLEAQACGRPVIAYGKGGALETVIESKTGTFFYENSVESMADAILRLEEMSIKKDDCRLNAEQFSYDIFYEKILDVVVKRIKGECIAN